MIDLTKNITNPSHYIRLGKEDRADLSAWKLFIDSFNGKSVFLSDNWVSSDYLKLFIDASGNVGYAAVYGSKFVAHQIAVKELYPISLALEIWGKGMKNPKVLFFV